MVAKLCSTCECDVERAVLPVAAVAGSHGGGVGHQLNVRLFFGMRDQGTDEFAPGRIAARAARSDCGPL